MMGVYTNELRNSMTPLGGELEFHYTLAVSYTHLDVYKRQTHSLSMPSLTGSRKIKISTIPQP